MTRVKICGLTDAGDVAAAVEAGADAIGFVFAPSPRRVEPDAARRLVRLLPPFVVSVGVFVDLAPDAVNEIVDRAGVDLVQLHGDESPEDAARIRRPVLKRFRAGADLKRDALLRAVARYPGPGFLLDPGGGDGRPFPWERAVGLPGYVVLAGGLTPENVGRALRTARPWAVDVCSGVERHPGRKSKEEMVRFVRAVKECDARPAA